MIFPRSGYAIKQISSRFVMAKLKQAQAELDNGQDPRTPTSDGRRTIGNSHTSNNEEIRPLPELIGSAIDKILTKFAERHLTESSSSEKDVAKDLNSKQRPAPERPFMWPNFSEREASVDEGAEASFSRFFQLLEVSDFPFLAVRFNRP